MKLRFYILLVFFLSAMMSMAQRPDFFPEQTNPTNENFEVYSQKNGVNTRASLGNLKEYFSPEINSTAIGYVPAATGNANNLMEFVTDPFGDRWYIDSNGKAILLHDESGGGDFSYSDTLNLLATKSDIGNGFYNSGTTNYNRDNTTNAYRSGHVSFGADIVTPIDSVVASFYKAIHIGNINSLPSSNSMISLNRSFVSATENAHGFTDGSDFTLTGGRASNSYDAKASFIGVTDADHYAAFQSSPTYAHTGTVDKHYGVFDLPIVNSGELTERFGVYSAGPSTTGSGEIVDNYGVYISRQNGNITGDNYGLYIQSNINTTPNLNTGLLIGNQGANGIQLKLENTASPTDDAFYIGGIGKYFVNLGSGNDVTYFNMYRAGAGLGDYQSISFSGSSTYHFGSIGFLFDDSPNGGAFSIRTIANNGTEVEQVRVGSNGTIFNYGYGSGNKEASDLSVVSSGYIPAIATNNAIYEVKFSACLDSVVSDRSYATNAAATTAGLTTGQVYYNTTSSSFVVLP